MGWRPEAASPTPGFHQKDKVENYLHDQVCSGAISLPEAQKEIATALAVGVREASFFYHAGAIASRLNDGVSAARYLNESLQLNPASECAGYVREELEKLHPASAASRQQE